MTTLIESISVLVMASILDYLLGDPWHWPHPVKVMGAVIVRSSRWLLQLLPAPGGQRGAGVVLGLGLILGSGGLGWGMIWGARSIHPGLAMGLQIVLLASCLAGRSLRAAAEAVLAPLADNQIAIARKTLSHYVGRDTQQLSVAEMYRAVMETLSENAVDGVFAPLFYAILGAAIPAIGAVPLALAYKAASTLDSMVGYRQAPYTYLGWFSARVEDGLTWLPCRLSVLSLALLAGKPKQILRICRRDAIADPSPNSGWSECAYAAILGIQLGGINYYGGIPRVKPPLADPLRPITPRVIDQATTITRQIYLIWLGLGIFGLCSLSRLAVFMPT